MQVFAPMNPLRVSALTVVVWLLTLGPAASQPPSAPSSGCDDTHGIRVAPIPGRSLYSHYRQCIFDANLPTQLGLPDNSEHSWIITVFGLTLFTEARMENEQSLVAVAASIL